MYNSMPVALMGSTIVVILDSLPQHRARYLVVDGSALLGDVAQAFADPRAAIPARYGPDLLDSYGVVGKLGSAHEGSGRALIHVQHAAVHNLGERTYEAVKKSWRWLLLLTASLKHRVVSCV